jgi:predicted 3-demethylubiquinone-9 3-methyltransferase (glyoxalase superfamily)
MNKITPCLWFDGDAEEAVAFYLSIFPNSGILDISRYPMSEHEEHQKRAGSVLAIRFELNGQAYSALNGGPQFKFNEAVSFQVLCDTQDEIDHYWRKLTEGGEARAQQCGWLKDKFGLSWQIVPTEIMSLMCGGDEPSRTRVMNALLKMGKLDIAALQFAATA